MKFDDALAIVERFFLDVIGTVFAGAMFLALLCFYFGLTVDPKWLEAPSSIVVFLLIGGSYALGHFLTYVGAALIDPPIRWPLWVVWRLIRFTPAGIAEEKEVWWGWVREVCATATEIIDNALSWTAPPRKGEAKTLAGEEAVALIKLLEQENYINPGRKFKRLNELRNLALSVEGVDKPLAHRFMFLGLFNLTMMAAIVAATTMWWFYFFLQRHFAVDLSAWTTGWPLHVRPYSPVFSILALVMGAILLERHTRFTGISMRMPIAEASMRLRKAAKRPAVLPAEEKASGTATVYLAGGFNSNWQDRLLLEFSGKVGFVDPRKHALPDPKNYNSWDLLGVRSCVVVFAYLENSNPGGYALALELGYGKAMGKLVIFVEEAESDTTERSKRLGMLRETADYHAVGLEAGMKILQSLLDQGLIK
jgi:hypothetical protein